MKKFLFIPFCLLFFINCKDDEKNTQLGEKWEIEIITHLDSLIKNELTPALSIAVFSSNEILYSNALGVCDASSQQVIDESTVFEAASLSKTVFSYLVMEMVREGNLELDRPLDDQYQVKNGLQDERRSLITPRMILSHQAALPNWRGKLNLEATTYDSLFSTKDTLIMLRDPGKRFDYSGEAYIWLQRAVEQDWKMNLQKYAQQKLFEPLQLKRTSYLFEAKLRKNAANGHMKYRDTTKRLEFHIPVAAGSLHSTALDYAAFFQHLLQSLKKHKIYQDMLLPEVLTVKKENYQVNWGLGLGILTHKAKRYLIHWGDNRIFKAYYMYCLEDDLGFVYFSNCQEGLRLRKGLAERVFGERIPVWP